MFGTKARSPFCSAVDCIYDDDDDDDDDADDDDDDDDGDGDGDGDGEGDDDGNAIRANIRSTKPIPCRHQIACEA